MPPRANPTTTIIVPSGGLIMFPPKQKASIHNGMLACPPDAASCERAAPSLPTGLPAGRAFRAEITAVELTGLAGDGLPAYTSLWAGPTRARTAHPRGARGLSR